MTRKKWYIIIASLLIINGLVFINRNNGFKYYPYKTYNEIYTTDSNLYLTNIHFTNNFLELQFSYSLSANDWKLYIDNKYIKNIKSNGSQVLVPLATYSHHYKLDPVNSPNALPVSVIADHSPAPDNTFDNEFLYCNLPGPGIRASAMKLWAINPDEFSKEERLFANQLLKDSIRISANDDDIAKTIKIGIYLRSLPNNPKGLPFYEVQKHSVSGQIKLSQQCKAELVCGNYSAMFRYLAHMSGLISRSITYSGPGGNWHYGSHFMNEVYLRKQQQWSVADASNNIFLPHDSIRFYNAADVKKMTDVNGFAGKGYYDLNNKTARIEPYEAVKNLHEYYNLSDADIQYPHGDATLKSTFSLLWQFYFPARDFDLYSDRNSNSILKLSIKTIFFLSLILAIIYYIAYEIKLFELMNKFRNQKKVRKEV
ncbi:MAG: hypothetical protein JWQ09_1805 [Segetibacter sp.]|nr:hypothetical protein [Segetibacter sp.]